MPRSMFLIAGATMFVGVAVAAVSGLYSPFGGVEAPGTIVTGDPDSFSDIGYAGAPVPTSAALANVTYYVQCGAASNGTGTSKASPWNSLSAVNGKPGGFVAGDRILFKRDSACTGQLAPQGSGAAGSPIVIGEYGTGSAKPLIQAQGAFEDTVLLQNQQHWEITNLRVTNKPLGATPTRGTYRGIHVFNTSGTRLNHIHIVNNEVFDIWTKSGEDAGTTIKNYKRWAALHVRTDDAAGSSYDDVLIQGNKVHDMGGTGIATTGELTTNTADYMTNVRLRENEIYNGRADGVIVRSSLNPLIEYNYVHNNGAGGSGFGSVGLWVRSTKGALVQYNESADHGSTGGDGQGFDADINAQDTVFQYNYSHGNHGGFLLVFNATSTGTIARYNLSVNDARFRAFLDLNQAAVIYNNTSVQRGTTNTKAITENANAATVFSNNIFWRSNAPATFYNGTVDLDAQWNNNVFYYVAGARPSDEPVGSSNITSDPKFVTAPDVPPVGRDSVGGYRLQVGSPAIGSGLVIPGNGAKDYFGNPVSASAAPNRGFYQGSGVAPGGPTNTLTATADTYLRDGTFATTNYGLEASVFVKGGVQAGFRRKTLLRFNVASLGSFSSVKLRIYAKATQDNTPVSISAYSVADDSWSETGATWSNAPARGASPLGSAVVNATQQYYEIDVTSFVQGQLVDDLASFMLEDSQSLDRNVSINSREFGSNPPQLVITT